MTPPDRRPLLGWAAACLLLTVAITAEWWGLGWSQGVAAAIAPPPAAPAPAAQNPIPPLGPLQAYAAVIERPLFTQSRRPPPEDGGAQPAAEGTLSVAGILISGGERIALIRRDTERKLTRVREGQSLGDWTIRSIAADRVTLAGRSGEATLLLQTRQAAKTGR
jgi:general secretion pathway protein N